MTELLGLRGLTRRFGSLTAVDGLDLVVGEGSRHAIIGPNGAGKTTLLHLIAGTLRPTAGRVVFAGRDVTAAGPARRARLGLARTFQTPAVCDSLTARENVLIGAWRRRRREREAAALRQLDALGLGSLAGVPAGRLAHGQRRLLEIGVALAAQPRLLLLDEPAAGLTDADLPHLLDALHALPERQAVLLVEHQMDVVGAVADTVTALDRGREVGTGPPGTVESVGVR
jgi:branched-chain amino acid transport system ATP-binding protein